MKQDFPIFKKKINGKRLVYLDNAATTQRPKVVVDAMDDFYYSYNANVHRGLHTLSEQATTACEASRKSIRDFIGARESFEIVFTTGTTMGINLIAYSWGSSLKAGDEIIISDMEHHANIVPWQELAKRKKIKLSYIPLTKQGELNYRRLATMVSKKTKLISIVHISNVLGTINDIERIVRIAKKVNAKVLLDAAQSIAHERINVAKLDVDFLVASGHKMYGPTGIGILYIRKEIAATIPPFLTGGDMILEVTKEKTIFQEPPQRFEAGTPPIAEIIGLGAAVHYLKKNFNSIRQPEKELTRYAYDKLSNFPGLVLYGPRTRAGVFSFNLAGIHAHDVAEILNRHGIAVRSGNHCAMPLHRLLKIPASVRASLACYNTKQDIDDLIKGLKAAQKFFKKSQIRNPKF